jgi:hypothetical protein
MPDFHMCDLCGLNRGTLHIDECVEGTILATAHLCDDCWYRMGIRIPLGNIWNHIQRAKQNLPPPPPPEESLYKETSDLHEEDEDEEDLNDLLDTSPLAVAEPDEDEDHDAEIEDALQVEGDRPNRNRDMLDLESLLEQVHEDDPSDAPQSLGIDAVSIKNIHPSLVGLFTWDLLVRCKAIPVRLEQNQLTVAFANPFDKIAVANIEVYVERNGFTFLQAFADEEEILRELERHRDPPSRFESLS